MAITYPRDLPANVRFMEQPSFDLIPVEAANRAGGSEQRMELGPPYWQAKYITEPLDWRGRAELHAWKDSMRGGKTFYGSDPFRWWPAAYGSGVLQLTRHAGGAFDGTAKVLTAAGPAVGLSTLPSTYRASAGDMIELPRAAQQISLHTILESVTAAAGAVTVSIDPPAFADTVINSVAVRLVKARAIMVIRAGTFDASAGVGKRSASFEAVQTLA